ncbi:MAG: hypothetical protein LBU69_02905, partial [Deltaproteobacteria bacterium]|nr:hypothetical protein [Deltaproteobacteria bacterium]
MASTELYDLHGGNVAEAAKRLNLPIDQILDFSANINPMGQPEGLREILVNSLDSTRHYPDPLATELTNLLASKANLPSWAVLPASGTTPLIYMLASHLASNNNLVIAPAFSEYERALSMAGIEQINQCVLSETNAFRMEDHALKFVCEFEVEDYYDLGDKMEEIGSDSDAEYPCEDISTCCDDNCQSKGLIKEPNHVKKIVFLANPANPTGRLADQK